MFPISIPGVYEINQDPQTKQIIPVFKSYKFDTPEKLYGEIRDYVNIIWKGFERNNYKGGVLLTGLMGSGKTEIGKILSNKAIEVGMSVYVIKDVSDKYSLISTLDNLDNCVLFFDEFGKNFPLDIQEKMLTLLSNPTGKRRIVVITENEAFRISRFIRSRPGRIKYSLNFDKLPKSVILDYCKDKKVDLEFVKEILEIYPLSTDFTFDHLKALVEERLKNPDVPTEILFKILNIEFLKAKKYIKLKRVTFEGVDITECVKFSPVEYMVLLEEDIAISINGNCKILKENKELFGKLSKLLTGSIMDNSEFFIRNLYFMKRDIVKSDENEVILKWQDLVIELEVYEKSRMYEEW